MPQKEVTCVSGFISFLKLQPEFLSQYYTYVDFYVNSNDFYEQLGINLTIAIVLDGGAKPSRGSIGFVIASADTGDPIVICWGQPVGIDPQSYLSEICSLLAAVQLLRLLMEFYNTHIHPPKVINNTFMIYTDSKSMLKKLERMDQYPLAPLKMILAPDWYFLHVVYNELK